MKILVVEDDHEAAGYLRKGLTEAGHKTDVAHDGDDGYAMAAQGAYDILIIDRMLPKRDGLTLLSDLSDVLANMPPVLILSALGDVDDRVQGLRGGGDDYLAKPYAFAELLARVEALARRQIPDEQRMTYEVGDLKLDRLSHRVTRAGQNIILQPREYRLLEFLMKHARQVVTRTMLLEGVWDYHFDPQTNVIDVHISRLRSKIDKEFEQPLLHTVRGAGYVLRDPNSE
ncbi:MAG: response regulator transcription factor [Pseudomonadota bacterium]